MTVQSSADPATPFQFSAVIGQNGQGVQAQNYFYNKQNSLYNIYCINNLHNTK